LETPIPEASSNEPIFHAETLKNPTKSESTHYVLSWFKPSSCTSLSDQILKKKNVKSLFQPQGPEVSPEKVS
jgi:hypothetical protein